MRFDILRCLCGSLMLWILSGGTATAGLVPVLLGDPVILNTGNPDGIGGVSVAYNSTDNEYRVAWYDRRVTDQSNVFAQRVSTEGTLLGTNTTITAAPDIQIDTAIAHSPVRNEYLITWRNQSGGPGTPGFNHRFGGIASATGGLTAPALDLSIAGLESTVVYNAIENEFIFEARGSGIRAQRVSTAGAPIGDSLLIASSGAPAPAGQIAYNPDDNQYLATWRDQSGSDLKGRVINADGSFATSAFQISATFPCHPLAASAAYDPINGRYLAVFGTFNGGPVLGQFVDSTGALVGTNFTIVSGTDNYFPYVAYDGVNRVYLVGWQNYNTNSLAVQLLDDNGTLAGDPLPIGDPGVILEYPRIAANTADGGFIITWVDRSWDPPEHHEVRAQIIGLAPDCPGDLDDDGDADLEDLAEFHVCFSGYGLPAPPECDGKGDFDGDGDVDLDDFLTFATCLSGPDCPAGAPCP